MPANDPFTEPNLPLMDEEDRPQDLTLDGRDLRFQGYRIKTLEQGGEYPDTMPQAIEVTDPAGRKALYVPSRRTARFYTAQISSIRLSAAE
ncbi:hypothetical protein [Bradyrhizobium sp. SZCCHNS3004]|uniref:hypothetical protein n=1 Tax=Bradyrhizobium sp. SZCCHNS3004 TaxID=3057312 RepID=UPI00291628DA|nr:hypothetical protein [Bradyrhizobium sp. SZCCHNS3004]